MDRDGLLDHSWSRVEIIWFFVIFVFQKINCEGLVRKQNYDNTLKLCTRGVETLQDYLFYHKFVTITVSTRVRPFFVLSRCYFYSYRSLFYLTHTNHQKNKKQSLEVIPWEGLNKLPREIPVENVKWTIWRLFTTIISNVWRLCSVSITTHGMFPKNIKTSTGPFIYPILWYMSFVYIYPGLLSKIQVFSSWFGCKLESRSWKYSKNVKSWKNKLKISKEMKLL